MSVRPAKTQISLAIRPVWSESSLSTRRKLSSLATHRAHSKDSDQTGRMPRLIWVFAGRTCHFVGFVMRRLIFRIWLWPVVRLYLMVSTWSIVTTSSGPVCCFVTPRLKRISVRWQFSFFYVCLETNGVHEQQINTMQWISLFLWDETAPCTDYWVISAKVSPQRNDAKESSTWVFVFHFLSESRLWFYGHLSRLMRLCHFSSSVNSFFKRAGAAIWWG